MTSLEISKLCTLTPLEYPFKLETLIRMETGCIASREEVQISENPVTSGTKIDALTCKRIVDDSTFVTDVRNLDIKGKTANNNQSEPVAKRPKYLHSFIWSDSFNDNFFSLTAQYMLSDLPLPRPP
jgi:hypothetical protein